MLKKILACALAFVLCAGAAAVSVGAEPGGATALFQRAQYFRPGGALDAFIQKLSD